MIDYSTVPKWVRDEIDEWAAIATWPGSFVEAVLKNDLADAFALAQEDQIAVLHSIVGYVHNYVPSPCWRSADNMKAWRGGVVKAFEKSLADLLDEARTEFGNLSEEEGAKIRCRLANDLIAAQRQRSERSSSKRWVKP